MSAHFLCNRNVAERTLQRESLACFISSSTSFSSRHFACFHLTIASFSHVPRQRYKFLVACLRTCLHPVTAVTGTLAGNLQGASAQHPPRKDRARGDGRISPLGTHQTGALYLQTWEWEPPLTNLPGQLRGSALAFNGRRTGPLAIPLTERLRTRAAGVTFGPAPASPPSGGA